MSEVFGQAVEGRILLFEETFYVGGDFVFVAEDEFIGVVENFRGFGLRQGDFAADGDQHGGGAPGLRIEQQRDGFQGKNLAAENGVARRGIRADLVRGGGQEFVDRGGGELLLDAVAVGGVFEGGDGDDVDGFGEGVVVACHVVTTSEAKGGDGDREC